MPTLLQKPSQFLASYQTFNGCVISLFGSFPEFRNPRKATCGYHKSISERCAQLLTSDYDQNNFMNKFIWKLVRTLKK